MQAQKRASTLRTPSWRKRTAAESPVRGTAGCRVGWRAIRSPAPRENRSWGPPGSGTKTEPRRFPTSLSSLTLSPPAPTRHSE